MKYVAIKLKGINHWFWFESENIVENETEFHGLRGWGKRGELTDIHVPKYIIEGKIFSEKPQYEN